MDAIRGTMVSLIPRGQLWAIASLSITFIIYFVPMLMIAFLCNHGLDHVAGGAVMLGAIIAFAITIALSMRQYRRFIRCASCVCCIISIGALQGGTAALSSKSGIDGAIFEGQQSVANGQPSSVQRSGRGKDL
jgi:hypothetical protein